MSAINEALGASLHGLSSLRMMPSGALTVRSQFAFLRFVAGMRALFALLGGIALVSQGVTRSPLLASLVLPYMVLAGLLLHRTQAGWPLASSKRWLWIDAALLVMLCLTVQQDAPWLGIISVVPVVAMSLLAGPLHAMAMALLSAVAMLLSADWHASSGVLPAPLVVPMAVLALGPAATFLALPSSELRQRLALIDSFNQRADPRRGLLHQVDVLLALLAEHFKLDSAVISLQGLEPRIFQRGRDGVTRRLDEDSSMLWRERRGALPDTAGCLCTGAQSPRVVGVQFDPLGSARVRIDERARHVLLDIGPETLALPLMSYGKPLGHLCVTRKELAFTVSDLQWLNDTMRELLPLLERSDLLEQLQRETAAAARERIGRDLHDSAVQPYLGLKYGLEALARQAGDENPISPKIRQLVDMTALELQTLRDVVSGLRHGDDPMGATAFMAALHRQVTRFEALYGLKVHIFAPDALQLRGSAAKAVLHMINEGLTNVRRHTAAAAVTVLLDVQLDQVTVSLRNDHGLQGASAPRPRDFTPRSLSERAREFGGSVCVTHEPNCTEVVITLPMFGALG